MKILSTLKKESDVMSDKSRRLTDAEIHEKFDSLLTVLGNQANLATKLSGQMLLMQAQLDMLEELFVQAEIRRGLKEERVRKGLEKTKSMLATSRLEKIGDTSPQMAEEVDIRGLLKRALDELESDEA